MWTRVPRPVDGCSGYANGEKDRTMRTSKLFAIPALVALTLLAQAAPVLAAPGGSGNGTTFPLVCDGQLSTLTVGGGPWSAAHLAESGETFVPVSTHFSIRDPETLEVLYEEYDFKGSRAVARTYASTRSRSTAF